MPGAQLFSLVNKNQVVSARKRSAHLVCPFTYYDANFLR